MVPSDFTSNSVRDLHGSAAGRRGKVVQRYESLIPDAKPLLNRVTNLAAHVLEVPMAVVSFVDEQEHRLQSSTGVPEGADDLQHPFCQHALQSDEPLVVKDTASDERFDAAATDGPDIRFYAGVPLSTPSDVRIGVLGVLDTEPHFPSKTAINRLVDLGALLMDELGVRRTVEINKDAEEERRVYRTAVEASDDSIYMLDPDYRYVFANREHICRLAEDGKIPERNETLVVGKRYGDVHSEAERDALRKRFEAVLETVETRSETYQFRTEQRWSHRTYSPVRHPETDRVEGIVVISKDITELKQREQELRKAKEAAEEANRIKSAFLANVSHEIRTPLTSIIGFAEAIGDQAKRETTDPDQIERFAELIEKSGQRLLNTLNSVLDLSKLEAGAMEMTPEAIDIVEEVQDAVDLFLPHAQQTNVRIETDFTVESVPVRLDGGAVQRILQNLLSNAIKFTDEDGKVTVCVWRDEDEVVFEIEDTGIGLDPTFRPHIFDPFEQESKGTSRAHEGTGLGLAVTKHLVDRMGGTIEVESEKGVGSCFTVRLPQQLDG